MTNVILKRSIRYFLVLVIGFVSLNPAAVYGSTDGLAHGNIDVNSLHLNKMLNEIRENIAKLLIANTGQSGVLRSADEAERQPLAMVEQAIMLLHEIVDGFNNNALGTPENPFKNLRIQYKFVNMCNVLKDVEHVEPYHLRKLKKKVEAFDKDVQAHCTREKNYLSKVEIEFFNKITQFNQILLIYLLRGEYLDTTLAEEFIDCLYHRPLEFMGDHQWITAAGLITVGVLVWYFYIDPMVTEFRLKSENTQVDVTQFTVPNQVRGGPCGVYTVANLENFMEGIRLGENDEQLRQRLAAGANLNAVWQAANGATNYLDGRQVQRLLANRGHVGDNVSVIEAQPGSDMLANLGAVMPAGMPARFNAGQTQFFAVNDGGHWLAYVVRRDPTALGGARVWTADSYWNRNVTNSRAIACIVPFLTGQPAPVQGPPVPAPAAH